MLMNAEDFELIFVVFKKVAYVWAYLHGSRSQPLSRSWLPKACKSGPPWQGSGRYAKFPELSNELKNVFAR